MCIRDRYMITYDSRLHQKCPSTEQLRRTVDWNLCMSFLVNSGTEWPRHMDLQWTIMLMYCHRAIARWSTAIPYGCLQHTPGFVTQGSQYILRFMLSYANNCTVNCMSILSMREMSLLSFQKATPTHKILAMLANLIPVSYTHLTLPTKRIV